MKVSIVTVVLNAERTICDTLQSVAKQTYPDIEHIIIDGGSKDQTLNRIDQYGEHVTKLVSEPDQGLYDAMNKGIALATGDVIGLLNADDFYEQENVIARVVETLSESDLDGVYADLVYVEPRDTARVTRTYTSGEHRPGLCFDGWMPAHPTLFLKREVYQRVGPYELDIGAQADLDFCARAFEIHKIKTKYVPRVWVRMREGGVSNNSTMNRVRANWASYKALKKLGLTTNPVIYFAKKFGRKLPGFFKRGAVE